MGRADELIADLEPIICLPRQVFQDVNYLLLRYLNVAGYVVLHTDDPIPVRSYLRFAYFRVNGSRRFRRGASGLWLKRLMNLSKLLSAFQNPWRKNERTEGSYLFFLSIICVAFLKLNQS